jgi:hypothetical protein
LIEDDVAFVNFRKFLIKSFEVTTAFSAAGSKNQIKNEFDLIITDLRLLIDESFL